MRGPGGLTLCIGFATASVALAQQAVALRTHTAQIRAAL
jgi:hypothetical protein